MEPNQFDIAKLDEMSEMGLEQIMRTASEKLEKLKKEKKEKGLNMIKDIMIEYDLTENDIVSHIIITLPPSPSSPKTKNTSPNTSGYWYKKANGILWNGKGPAPKWLKDVEAHGYDKESFLIRPETEKTDYEASITVAMRERLSDA